MMSTQRNRGLRVANFEQSRKYLTSQVVTSFPPMSRTPWYASNMFMALLLTTLAAMMAVTTAVPMCPAKCECLESELTVNCMDASLDVVPITLNPQLRQLRLNFNQIKSIIASFTFYRHLEFLDISYNNLTTIGRRNFASQRYLRVLLLAGNKLSEISVHSFSGLSSLRILNLDDNQVDRLEAHVFSSLSNLEVLRLSRNLISSLDESTFSGLINLKQLILHNNRLAAIPASALAVLTSLRTLDISGNYFAVLESNAFPSLPSLREVNLNSCSTQSIEGDAFVGLAHLDKLTLAGNGLTEVPTESLEGLTKLRELDLSNNRISQLEAFAFSGLTALQVLYIRSNHELEEISEKSFAANGNLTSLAIEFCPKVSNIHENTFSSQRSTLKELVLRGNGLVGIPRTLFTWSDLRTLDLRSNPLNCTCDLLWLWEYFQSAQTLNASFSSELICHSPSSLSGQPFLSVSMPDMACYESHGLRQQLITLAISALALTTGFLLCSSLFAAVSLARKRAWKAQEHHRKMAGLFGGNNGPVSGQLCPAGGMAAKENLMDIGLPLPVTTVLVNNRSVSVDTNGGHHAHIYAEPMYSEPLFYEKSPCIMNVLLPPSHPPSSSSSSSNGTSSALQPSRHHGHHHGQGINQQLGPHGLNGQSCGLYGSHGITVPYYHHASTVRYHNHPFKMNSLSHV